ncbi:MAG: DUF697 domain-containing protein [Oscillospiraceae bacterium]|nr:DUF697 domain-containing protein [Oscillospiraceae bacterium]MDD4368400.1 DUF697 domain-containing protein [Oscillospiraceae bacterium]
MSLNAETIAEACIKAINDKIKNLKTLNIIVAGKTGVGKSTLINCVFREELAATGIGRPLTDHMRRISKKGFPLAIYDTRGFELGRDAQHQVRQEILATIKQGVAQHDINAAIHCIWYCINTASNRVEPEELDWLRSLAQANQQTQVPVIIVLTQSFSKAKAAELRNYLLDQNLDVLQIVPVLAADYEIDQDYVIKAYGLDVLIKVMSETLPEELQDTFQNVQKACLTEKRRRAQAAIAAATTAAFGVGFTPIPIADAALLIPTQVTMLASITAIYGLTISKSMLIGFISMVLGTGGTTMAGRLLVSNLLKLLPGVGTITGGTISGATAGMLTTALGGAYIALMEAVYKGELSRQDLKNPAGQKQLRDLVQEQFKHQKPGAGKS